MSSEAWSRLLGGETTLVVGPLPRVPAHTPALVFEIDCRPGEAPLYPLVDLCDRIEAWLGDYADEGAGAVANPRLWGAMRQRLTDRLPPPMSSGRLLGTLRRLANASVRPSFVVFRHLERADDATIDLLRVVVAEEQALPVPLLFHVTQEDRVRDLADAVVEKLGNDAVVRPTEGEGEPLPVLRDLPPEVRRALRAGAVLGGRFDAVELSRVLRVEPLAVIETMQDAIDLGLAVRDRGRGRYVLAPDLADHLDADISPSLAEAWRFAASLEDEWEEEPFGDEVETDPFTEGASPARVDHSRVFSIERVDDTAAGPVEEWFEPAAEPGPDVVTPEISLDERTQRLRRPVEWERSRDRNAELERVREALDGGAFEAAVKLARQFLAELPDSPRTNVDRVLEARARLYLGRGLWLAPPLDDEPPSLPAALEELDQGLDIAEAVADVTLAAELRASIAAVCYDQGSAASLERALRELTAATVELSNAGHAIEAACLLNDTAVVWLRIGDPVRAYHLLERSRELFTKIEETPTTLRELAETSHWMARLFLHAKVRPGREKNAISVALQRGEEAAGLYREIEDEWGEARVWETMARLRMLGDDPVRAAAELERCVARQRVLGDVTGLARSIAAYSELLEQAGESELAVDALEQSIALNAAKGSAIGLAFNRRALERLRGQGLAGPVLDELDSALSSAARGLGDARLPEDLESQL